MAKQPEKYNIKKCHEIKYYKMKNNGYSEKGKITTTEKSTINNECHNEFQY